MNFKKYKHIFLETGEEYLFVTYDFDESYKSYQFIDSLTYAANIQTEPLAIKVNENRAYNSIFEDSKDSLYNASFSWNAVDVLPDSIGTVVMVKFKLKLEDIGSKALIAAASPFKDSDKSKWKAVRLLQLNRAKNEWKEVVAVFDLGKRDEGETAFSTYFYNDQKEKVFVKEIEVGFYYYRL